MVLSTDWYALPCLFLRRFIGLPSICLRPFSVFPSPTVACPYVVWESASPVSRLHQTPPKPLLLLSAYRFGFRGRQLISPSPSFVRSVRAPPPLCLVLLTPPRGLQRRYLTLACGRLFGHKWAFLPALALRSLSGPFVGSREPSLVFC